MSSSKPTPTIAQLLDAYAAGAQSKDELADTHRGSGYDALGGMGALIWTRVSSRDREVFRGIYLDGCRDDSLDERIFRMGGPARILAKRGAGQAKLTTSTPASLTAYTGTRIAVTSSSGQRLYRIAEDVQSPVASSLCVAIEAEEYGQGYAVDSSAMSVRMAWEDMLISSSSWTIADLRCSDGTSRESDAAYLARFRAWKEARRPGYADFITRKMLECGASKVALFESHLVDGADGGVNRIFVDGGQALLDKCRLALDSSVAFGCTTTVGVIARQSFTVAARLQLFQSPSKYDRTSLNHEALQACRRALSGTQTAYVFSREAIQAELFRAIPDLQEVTFLTPTPASASLGELIKSSGGQLMAYEASGLTGQFSWEGPS